MFYALLGRAVWWIFRRYARRKFPHARRNLAVAAVVACVLAAAGVIGSRRRSDEFHGPARS